jgi:uncharacterized protein YbjT (DUF2867 family)
MKIAVAGATGRVGRHVVEVLEEDGHDVVPMSRSVGVDVISGDGLAAALSGVETIIDVATGPSPDQAAATEFFTTAACNLHETGERAGVQRMVVVSIIGTDKYTAGYGAAKMVHEQAMLAGPVPTRVLRAAQFHEFVPELVAWGTEGDIAHIQQMRVQPVSARTVARALVDLATDATWGDGSRAEGWPYPEIAGPQPESLVDLAERLVARRGGSLKVEAVGDPVDPDRELNESGGLLPSPHAVLAGPTFQQWLDAGERER